MDLGVCAELCIPVLKNSNREKPKLTALKLFANHRF
jgi:hypothetical protein